MASSIAQRRLGEFLKEQQEPFTLQDYLLERGYSTRCGMLKSSSSSSSCLNKDSHNTKFVLPFSKVLTPLYKKLVASHNESSGSSKTKEISDIGNSENLAISADEADRFSSASSSTLFNSCSETEVDDDHHHQAWFSSDTCHIGENRYKLTYTFFIIRVKLIIH